MEDYEQKYLKGSEDRLDYYRENTGKEFKIQIGE